MAPCFRRDGEYGGRTMKHVLLRANRQITHRFRRAAAAAGGVRLHRRIGNTPASPSLPALSSPGPNRRVIYRSALTIAALLLAATARPVSAQSTWALTPYRIELDVLAESDEPLAQRVRSALTVRAEATMGAQWHLEGVVQSDAAGEEEVELDKRFTVELTAQAGAWSVAVRELDVRTGKEGPTVRRDVLQPAKLIDGAWDAVLEAFRPVARIVDVEITRKSEAAPPVQSGAVIQLRAGRLPGADTHAINASRGALFRPILRRMSRGRSADDEASESRVVPWTYLVAERVSSDGRIGCRVETGLRAPLPARPSRRTRRLALMVRPQPRPTTLEVRARAGENEPLPDFEILLASNDDQPPTMLGLTDHRGRFVLPDAHSRGATAGLPNSAEDPHPSPLPEGEGTSRLPIIVLVRSGERTLARLPIVPGLEETVTAYVPDDRPRLRAEAFTSALGERLIDVALQREILMARARLMAEQGEMAEARSLVNELTSLPDRDWFARRVETYRRRQLQGEAELDPSVRREIDKMTTELKNLIGGQLDPAAVERIRTEIAQAR